MKYCIIGMPRSRSSMLLEAISNYLSIPIFGNEIISIPWHQRTGDTYIKKMKFLLSQTNKLSNGIIKLHPLQLISRNPMTLINFDWFNFKQYDKIYFTLRKDISDNIASNFVAEKLNRYTYRSESDVYKNIKPMTFTADDHYNVDNYIWSTKILHRLETYFVNNNIEYTSLDYDDIPTYIKQNYPAEVYHVETHYDYKNIVANYEELIKVYKEKMYEF